MNSKIFNLIYRYRNLIKGIACLGAVILSFIIPGFGTAEILTVILICVIWDILEEIW